MKDLYRDIRKIDPNRGSTLGDGCTIGPNSVVKGNYGPGTTLIGNPARAVRIAPQATAPK